MNINTNKRVLALLIALSMIFALAACGGGGKSPAGTYNLSKISENGEEITAEEMAEIIGMDIGMTLELTKDNKFTLNMGLFGDEGEESISGAWKMDGDSMILSVEDVEWPVTCDDNTVELDMEGAIFTFEKQ